MGKVERVQMHEIIRKPSRFTLEELVDYDIEVPENLKGQESVLVEEFAVLRENRKHFVLVSDFEKGLLQTNTTRELREISTYRYQTNLINLQEMFFSDEERVKGVPFERLEKANQKLVQLGVNNKSAQLETKKNRSRHQEIFKGKE